MKQRTSTSETMAAERILAILLEGRNMADNDKRFEGMDNWSWAIDASNDIQEVMQSW